MGLLNKLEGMLQNKKDKQIAKNKKQKQWEKEHPEIMKLKKQAKKILKKIT